MPKFLSYQRPTPVKKDNWNVVLNNKTPLLRRVATQAKPDDQVELPPLDQLLRKH